MVGATFKRINVEDVKNYVSVFPPHKTEQHELASKLDLIVCSIENVMIKAVKIIDYLQEHRSSLITAAVTGKIDVRDFKPEDSAA